MNQLMVCDKGVDSTISRPRIFLQIHLRPALGRGPELDRAAAMVKANKASYLLKSSMKPIASQPKRRRILLISSRARASLDADA